MCRQMCQLLRGPSPTPSSLSPPPPRPSLTRSLPLATFSARRVATRMSAQRSLEPTLGEQRSKQTLAHINEGGMVTTHADQSTRARHSSRLTPHLSPNQLPPMHPMYPHIHLPSPVVVRHFLRRRPRPRKRRPPLRGRHRHRPPQPLGEGAKGLHRGHPRALHGSFEFVPTGLGLKVLGLVV